MPDNHHASPAPRFVVQRAGSRAKILAVYERQYVDGLGEAATVTTVDDIPTAAHLAHLLNNAWAGIGYRRFDVAALQEHMDLPEAVLTAIADAVKGCPSPSSQAADYSRYMRAHEIGGKFVDNRDAKLSARQAFALWDRMMYEHDAWEDDEAMEDEFVPSVFDAAVCLAPAWKSAMQQAFHNLAFDIRCGIDPSPTTYAEIVALRIGADIVTDLHWDELKEFLEGSDADHDSDSGFAAFLSLAESEDDEDPSDWVDVYAGLVADAFRAFKVERGSVHTLEEIMEFLPLRQWHDLLPGATPRDPARLLQ